MAIFSYAGRTDSGKPSKGTLDAPDKQAALEALRDMEIIPDSLTEVPPAAAPSWTEVAEEPAVSFSAEPLPIDSSSSSAASTIKGYHPLTDTLRLYAGWLLAWYFLIFAAGSYQFTRDLPFDVPYLEDLFLSKTLLGFSCASFLFLFLSSVHRLLRGGVILGIIFTLAGFGVFAWFRAAL